MLTASVLRKNANDLSWLDLCIHCDCWKRRPGKMMQWKISYKWKRNKYKYTIKFALMLDIKSFKVQIHIKGCQLVYSSSFLDFQLVSNIAKRMLANLQQDSAAFRLYREMVVSLSRTYISVLLHRKEIWIAGVHGTSLQLTCFYIYVHLKCT